MRRMKNGKYCKICGQALIYQKEYCTRKCRWIDPEEHKKHSISTIKGATKRCKNLDKVKKPKESRACYTCGKILVEQNSIYCSCACRWANPEEHEKASKCHLDSYLKKPEIKKKQSKSRVKSWQNLKYRVKQEKAHGNMALSGTKIELKIQNLLQEENIKFETQKFLRGKPDLFVDPNVCIFADGDYYHANPRIYTSEQVLHFRNRPPILASKIWAHDKEVTECLEGQGYFVLRFWEHDIKNNLGEVKSKILESVK